MSTAKTKDSREVMRLGSSIAFSLFPESFVSTSVDDAGMEVLHRTPPPVLDCPIGQHNAPMNLTEKPYKLGLLSSETSQLAPIVSAAIVQAYQSPYHSGILSGFP